MKNGLEWLIEGPDDFEYKKYRFLNLMQDIGKDFKETKLNPHFETLKDAKSGITEYDSTSKRIFNSTKTIKSVNFKTTQNVFYSEFYNKEKQTSLSRIIDFAKPIIDNKFREGVEIEKFAYENCIVEPVGILPIYKKEGMLFYPYSRGKEIVILKYTTGIFRNDSYQSDLKFFFLKCIMKSIFETYEAIKNRIVSSLNLKWNIPAYIVQTEIEIPLIETFFPVSKMRLSEIINE